MSTGGKLYNRMKNECNDFFGHKVGPKQIEQDRHYAEEEHLLVCLLRSNNDSQDASTYSYLYIFI